MSSIVGVFRLWGEVADAGEVARELVGLSQSSEFGGGCHTPPYNKQAEVPLLLEILKGVSKKASFLELPSIFRKN